MICKISFSVHAVLKVFLFAGGEAAGKLYHQYCDSKLFILQATGAICRLLHMQPRNSAVQMISRSINLILFGIW